MNEEKKEEVKERYELVEVPTQTAVVIKETDTEKIYDSNGALLEILKKLDKIEKVVA